MTSFSFSMVRIEEEMKRKIVISNEDEANLIIKWAEGLIKKGHKLTDKEEAKYIFAKMFLNDIKRRKKKKV